MGATFPPPEGPGPESGLVHFGARLALVPDRVTERPPLARLRYRNDSSGVACDVLVDGEPVAQLPATGIEFVHDPVHSIPVVKVGVSGAHVDVEARGLAE